MKNRFEEVKQELLNQCDGNNGESCGGDPSVGIFPCRFFDAGYGCALKREGEYDGVGLNNLAAAVHKNAVDHGWWDEEREFGTIIALSRSSNVASAARSLNQSVSQRLWRGRML